MNNSPLIDTAPDLTGRDFDSFTSDNLGQLNAEIHGALAMGKAPPVEQALAMFAERMRRLYLSMEGR
jgi:hypothetical protein